MDDETTEQHPFPAPQAAPPGPYDLERVAEIPLDLSVEIGHCSMTVGETLALTEGSIVTLERFAGEPVDLLVNGTVIARGEVVVVDEKFGLRVSQILDPPADGLPEGLGAERAGAEIAGSPVGADGEVLADGQLEQMAA